MSTLKVNNLQVGQDATATNNFTLYQPSTPNGTVRLGVGNVGSVTDVLTVTSARDVGIGTTSPVERFHIAKNSATGPSLYITNDSTGHTATDGLQFGFDGSNDVEIRNRESTRLRLYTSNTERLQITSTGDVNVLNGNLVIGTSGKGIDFSATGNSSGSMTSELLSDYEEGTWTPVFQGTISNPTVTYTQQNGWYTKIGNIVYITIILTTSAASGGSGDLRIGGLPYGADTSGFYQMHRLNISEALSMTTAITSAIITEEITTTQIFTDVTTAALGPGSNNNRIRINGWYRAA